MPKKETVDDYLHEVQPKKQYVKKPRFFRRKRKPFELFWDEILIALVIIIMLAMLFINIYSTYNKTEPAKVNETINEVDVNVGVEQYAGVELNMPELLSYPYA